MLIVFSGMVATALLDWFLGVMFSPKEMHIPAQGIALGMKNVALFSALPRRLWRWGREKWRARLSGVALR